MTRVLEERERAVLDAATARLVPGPEDDPGEAGYPGAREAGAADYIVGLLDALHDDPPRVYADGERFLPLSATVTAQWQARLAELVPAYHEGLAALDELAGGDFAAALPAAQDAALAANPRVPHLPAGVRGFTDLLFRHTIEGCYGAPVYGGNADGVMWRSIGFPGDVQPHGHPADRVTASDGPDPCTPTPTGIVADLLRLLTATAPGSPK